VIAVALAEGAPRGRLPHTEGVESFRFLPLTRSRSQPLATRGITPRSPDRGGESLRVLARAAHDIRAGRHTSHPELLRFPSWGLPAGLRSKCPCRRRPAAARRSRRHPRHRRRSRCRPPPGREDTAGVTASTVHKTKGPESGSVKIADDFTPPRDTDEIDGNGQPVPGRIDEAEARLAFVSHPDGTPTTPDLTVEPGNLTGSSVGAGGPDRSGRCARASGRGRGRYRPGRVRVGRCRRPGPRPAASCAKHRRIPTCPR
jgi:hypothetical protein